MTHESSPASSLHRWTVDQLSVFYIEHRVSFIAQAQRLLFDRNRAEEIVQDALVRVLLASPELQSSDHALAYFRKTVTNLCIDVVRIEGQRPRLVLLDDVSAEMEKSFVQDEDQVDLIASADDAAIIRNAISLLSPAERTALIMWELEGRTSKEIASQLKIKESTVRHTVARARKSLRKILSEYVVDADRGITALDLLSVSYKKSIQVAKKSSKAAMSFVLLLIAYFGIGSVSNSTSNVGELNGIKQRAGNEIEKPIFSSERPDSNMSLNTKNDKGNPSIKVSKDVGTTKFANAKASKIMFSGLDANGLPTAFTITDSAGNFGSMFVTSRDATYGDSDFKFSWISKTLAEGPNLLMTQTLVQDSAGLSFDAFISYGRGGKWVPLVTRVISTETERQVSGSYLISAVIQVKSEVESPIITPATAGGQDLEAAPLRVVTRILLNSSKTRVMAQAVQVFDRPTK